MTGADVLDGALRLGGRAAGVLAGRAGPRASAFALVAANLIVLASALLHGWPVGDVLLVYWLESAVIGVLNVVRMLTAGRRDGGPFDAVGLALFFSFHYGIFMFVHLGFLVAILNWGAIGDPFSQMGAALSGLLATPSGLFAVAALVASHLVSFFVNYLPHERADVAPDDLFARPYGRIIAMHVAILFGFAATLVLGLGARWGAVAVVLLKLPLDVRQHLHERAKLLPPASGPAT